jgi:hypothetical protein
MVLIILYKNHFIGDLLLSDGVKNIGQPRTCFYLTLDVKAWIASAKSEHQKFVGLQMHRKLLFCIWMKCQQISVTCCQIYRSFLKLNISEKY